jgi:hypothetical protein
MGVRLGRETDCYLLVQSTDMNLILRLVGWILSRTFLAPPGRTDLKDAR